MLQKYFRLHIFYVLVKKKYIYAVQTLRGKIGTVLDIL